MGQGLPSTSGVPEMADQAIMTAAHIKMILSCRCGWLM
jgi:hypothetical protein